MPTLETVVGIQRLQVIEFGPANLGRGLDKVAFRVGGAKCTAADVDRSVRAVNFGVGLSMECLDLRID